MSAPQVLQWLGAATGIGGTVLVALNSAYSGWGFVLYLVSNACWIAFGIRTRAPGLTVQHAIYVGTSLLGIWFWLFAPA